MGNCKVQINELFGKQKFNQKSWLIGYPFVKPKGFHCKLLPSKTNFFITIALLKTHKIDLFWPKLNGRPNHISNRISSTSYLPNFKSLVCPFWLTRHVWLWYLLAFILYSIIYFDKSLNCLLSGLYPRSPYNSSCNLAYYMYSGGQKGYNDD